MSDIHIPKRPSQILSFLYIGGKNDAKDRNLLKELNIKYILNCTPTRNLDPEAGVPNFYEKEKLFVYKRVPIFDNRGEDITSHFDSTFKFIEEGKHYGSILVHCHKGISRSASFVIAYLMRKNQFTFEEALAHVQSCRSIVSPNSSFIKQLSEYIPIPDIANNETKKLDKGTKRLLESEDLTIIGPDCGPNPITIQEEEEVESKKNKIEL